MTGLVTGEDGEMAMVMKVDTEEMAPKHHPGRCFTEISQQLTWANCSLHLGWQSFFCSSVEQRGQE